MRPRSAAQFWDAAARADATWFVATGHRRADRAFFAQGAAETDRLLAFCGITVRPGDRVVEIGCGVGRMTRRLAELTAPTGRVIATDISQEMLVHAKSYLAGVDNVDYVRVSGDGSLPLNDACCDLVFSYITLQHVPATGDQVRYLLEGLRVLRPRGALAVQVRAPGLTARAFDWAGHLGHYAQGRPTMHRAWRGATLTPDEILAIAPELRIRQYGRRHIWVVARRGVSRG